MAKRPSPVKEAVIESALVRRVEARGGMCVKVQVIGRRGFVDRLVVLPKPPFPARVLFVEVKKPRGGRVAFHQMQWHEALRTLGAEVAVVRTLEDIDRMLSPVD
jgi:hypothetical protein